MFLAGSTMEIQRLSYKERLELFAERYSEIRRKHLDGDKNHDVSSLMQTFTQDYERLATEIRDWGA